MTKDWWNVYKKEKSEQWLQNQGHKFIWKKKLTVKGNHFNKMVNLMAIRNQISSEKAKCNLAK